MWTRYLLVLVGLIPVLGYAQVGVVVSLEGAATAVAVNQSERSLSVSSDIQLNDRVTTLAGAKLEIKLVDDTIISMGELSEMVIDEYVVAPQDPEASRGSIKLVKGLFRMITGKVTKLNPDQFRVRTRVATIGIRGCDIGYEVSEEDVNVMALEFAPGESLIVRMIDPTRRAAAGGWDGILDGDWNVDRGLWRESRSIDRAGQMMSVNPRSGMRESRATPQQLKRLVGGVTPGSEDESGATPDSTNGSESDGTGDEGEEGMGDDGDQTDGDATSGEGDAGDGVTDSEPVDDTQLDADGDPYAPSDQTDDGNIFDENTLAGDLGEQGSVGSEPFFSPILDGGADLPYQPGEDIIVFFPNGMDELNGDVVILPDGLELDESTFLPLPTDTLPDEEPGDDDGTTPVIPPQPPPEEPPVGEEPPSEPVFTPWGGGTHWSWGVWQQDGKPQGVEFTGTHLMPLDVQSLINGATMYNLSGSGNSAAIVKESGNHHLLTGSADLSVQIGGSVMPTWDGMFSLADGHGAALDFTATGSIQHDGSLQGNQQSYLLTVGGNSFDRSSITFENIHGYLVGDNLGAPPVSGAVGSFQFDHGAAVSVQGGFGADLH